MTLEEFLVRAGVVREDMPQQIGKPNGCGWFGDFPRSNNNTGLLVGFQQPTRSSGNLGKNKMVEGNNPVSKQPPRASKQQAQQRQPSLFPKPANVAFAAPMHLLNNEQFASHGIGGGMVGVREHSMNGALVQSNALPGVGNGMVGLATANETAAAAAAAASPASKISPDVITKSSVDTSLLSPVPCVINRGRKCSAIEKLVERRQSRMIKNKESAARSRARKQAYTLELEAKVANLKELNQELQRKQAEIMEMLKNQASDTVYQPWGSKRQCLRRTVTGPW